MHKKLAYIIKHYQFVQLMYRIIMSACIKFIGLFTNTHEKLVLFSSYGGMQYSDSPRILFETMLNDSRFRSYQYVWAFEKPDNYNVKNARKIKIDSPQYFLTALKAKVWITNVNIERGLDFKKKGTIYLNTWHGTGPKKGGNAVRGRKDYDFSRVDILCCDGDYTHDVFLKYWNAKEESMLWCGRPREDELLALTEDDRKRIRKILHIPNNKKFILYMPTWRDYGNKELDYDAWENALNDSYVMGIRTHHFATDCIFHSKSEGFWRDMTAYPNVNELYCAADILISDYSSSFFDYGLLEKPMYCYAYDYDNFIEKTGLFMDLEHEFPNGVMRTEHEVIRAILDMDYLEECRKSGLYCKQYVKHPVNATKCCIDALFNKLVGEDEECKNR